MSIRQIRPSEVPTKRSPVSPAMESADAPGIWYVASTARVWRSYAITSVPVATYRRSPSRASGLARGSVGPVPESALSGAIRG